MKALLTTALTLSLACGASTIAPTQSADVDDERLLILPREISPDFTLQQKVSATFDGREIIFQAIIQKVDDRLTIVALTPQGQRAFVLEQVGKKVSFEGHSLEELPFAPRHILVDIHRCYFRGDGQSRADGEHLVAEGFEVVREEWTGGRLRERTFELPREKRPGQIRIRYEDGEGSLLERKLTLENAYLGYSLAITPLGYTKR